MAHNLNLLVRNGLPLWDKLTKKEKNELKRLNTNMVDEIDDKDDGNDDEYDDTETIDENESEFEDELVEDEQDNQPNHESNKDSNSIFDESESEFESEIEESKDKENDQIVQINSNQDLNDSKLTAKIKSILNKTRAIIRLSNQSNVIFSHIKQLLMDSEVSLPSLALDMPVRWNSTYLMIKNFIKYKDYINKITKNPQSLKKLDTKMQPKLESLVFSQLDWELLELLQDVLQTFYLSTVLISARKYSTLSITYFVQANIEYYLNTESTGKHRLYHDKLKRKLNEQFIKYFDKNLSQDQKDKTTIAAFLDPSIFNEIIDSDLSIA